LAHTPWRVVPIVAAGVLRDVQPPQPDFAGVDGGIGIHQAGLALPQGLDLCTHEHHPAFVGIEDVVIVARLAVGSNDGRAPATWFGGLLPLRSPGIHRGALLSHDCSHVTSRAASKAVELRPNLAGSEEGAKASRNPIG